MTGVVHRSGGRPQRSAGDSPSRRLQPINTTLQSDRKSTQRERLLSAMIEVAAREGYAAASIAQVIANAGVSRPTFYDYFTDKDDCFLAAVTDIHGRLQADVGKAIDACPHEHAAGTAIETLIGFAATQPERARFLMTEAMAGAFRSLDSGYRGVAQIGQAIEEAYRELPPTAAVPDLSGRILTGGVYRLLAARLRREQPAVSGMLDDLLVWIKAYERPIGEHRWRTLEPVQMPVASGKSAPLLPPLALPARRRRASAGEVAENHRQHIMFAAAELAAEKGYRAATIAGITKLAGVDAHTFYSLFGDKQEVYAAVHELYFQHLMARTAGAFFSGAGWPDRVWEAGLAFTRPFEENPTLAHVGFVEAYSAGPAAEQRLDEFLMAFTVFLQQGYEYVGEAEPPSAVALEAIAATIFAMARHLVRDQVRHRRPTQLSGLLPHVNYICLAPFIGAVEANRFIDQKLKLAREER
jgi:AcrR family transcriptional regulator